MEWNKLNSSRFEELCCVYAKSNYGGFAWEPTQHSWDGNKDGEFIYKIDSINQLLKGWYESKYTKYPDQSIPHSHMDSTLVSGVLDGHVVYILFITNGKITREFKRRANAILIPHRIEVNFIDGELLEEWLLRNHKVYSTFFGKEIENCIIDAPPSLDIEEVCFFEGVMSAPILTENIKSLTINNDYYMYLGIRSNIATACTINIDTDCVKLHENNAHYVDKLLHIGYNSIFLKCRAQKIFNGQLKLTLKAGSVSKTYDQLSFVICDDYSPRIIYAEQTAATQQMYDFLRTECSDNAILTLSGSEGDGKSYLIRKLIESISSEGNECLTIQLSDKSAENACALCKLILFLNFGNLYELSEEAFYKLIEASVNLPMELFAKLREGSVNQLSAIHVIHEMIQICKDNGDYALIPYYNAFMHRQTTYIFIDDIHKLGIEYAHLFKLLIAEFSTRCFSQVIIMGYRSEEFTSPGLENVIQKYSQKSWSLRQLSSQDIKETLTTEFNSTIGELSEFFPQPINVLHLAMLIKQLRLKRIEYHDALQISAVFSDAYNVVNSQNHQFARHKLEISKYHKEIFIIYKIESGIPKEILYKYWGEEARVILNKLLWQEIIKETRGLIIPFHDVYLYAFNNSSVNDKKYYNELVGLLNYIWEIDDKYETLESNIISILIEEGDMTLPDLRQNAYKYCRQYFSASKYYAVKLIAKALLPDLEHTTSDLFDTDMIEILYMYAQSIKFTESHEKSTKLFKKITQIVAKSDISSQARDISWEALSEILNNEMWMLNFNETKKCIEKLEKMNHTKISTTFGENAYLNYLNRSMMCDSFSSPIVNDKLYELAISESCRLKRDDYAAFTKMDRAKTLYHTLPQQSINLLKDADTILNVNKAYYRRSLECKSEIAFLEAILYDKNFDELYAIQREMLSQGYINSYSKTTLKLITIELVQGLISTETARTRLNRLILQNPEALKTKRLKFIVYQLLALISYIDGNEIEYQKYCHEHHAILIHMNDSYRRIPIHNLSSSVNNNEVCWAIGDTLLDESFWVDPRLW